MRDHANIMWCFVSTLEPALLRHDVIAASRRGQCRDVAPHFKDDELAIIAVASNGPMVYDDLGMAAVCSCYDRNELYRGLLEKSNCMVFYICKAQVESASLS